MIKIWIKSFRLRTLPLAFACVGMGGFLAAFYGYFDMLLLVLSILTTLFLQILSNLANDYGDSIHGADNVTRKGPSRAVQEGVISPMAMKRAIKVFSLLSFVAGLFLLYHAFHEAFRMLLIFALIGIAAIIAAITYTNGNRPYGYAGFGDLAVLLFFGFAAVIGSYYLYAQKMNWLIVLPAISCGLFAVGVLNINNIRDIDSDKEAGKYSIPVRLGREKGVYYHWALLSLGFLSAIIFTLINFKGGWQFLYLVTLPLFFKNAVAVYKNETPEQLDPYLKQLALSTLLFVLVFGLGLLI